MLFAEQLKNAFTINVKWFPIKLHYFFMFGTIAGVLPFMPVIGKDLGLSATAVGISYTLQPIFIFLFKPVFGYLADCLQNIKIMVICLLTGTVILQAVVLFIKPLPKTSCLELEAKPNSISQVDETHRNLSSLLNESCIRIASTIDGYESLYRNSSISNNITGQNLIFPTKFSCIHNDTLSYTYWIVPNSTSLKCYMIMNSNLTEEDEEALSLNQNNNQMLEECLVANSNPNFYSSYQFWAYTCLIITIGTFFTTSISLTDVACYEIIGEKKEYYGRQRLYGTLSTGIVSLLAGYINSSMSRDNSKTTYLAGYYIMFAFFIVNMGVLVNINLPKTHLSKDIFADVTKVFKSMDVVVFSLAVFLIGNFSGLVANYLFWYLKELGASQTLLGMTITFQCLTAELPFFFIAGWFVKHLGHFNCLTCSFAAFSLRFGLYSLLRDPWLTLPIETLHGFTFAVFYSAKSSFATGRALPGTEGTLLGILGGLCDGLGFASGSFLGGLAFDRIGGRRTFLSASILSLLCVPVTFISHFVYKRRLSHDTV